MATRNIMRLAAPFLPVAGALFCIQLDFFSLSLALPTIAADLGTTATNLQWLLSGYMIALGSLLIPAGRAGDMLGRRRVLLVGVGVFGLTSLACGLVSSVPVLIAARVAQGVGGAMIMPTAIALVSNATTEDDRPQVTGALLGIAGVGTALGPVVGGVLATEVSWRWVFLLNVPIAAAALWGGLRLQESRDETGPHTLAGLDWWGVATVVAGLVLISIAIDDVGVEGWTSAVTLVPLLAGIALLATFCVIETRASTPLVRPSLLHNSVFVVLTVAGTLANIGATVYIVLATLELQNVRGLSAAAAGLVFFVSSVGLASCGPLSGRLSVRYPAGIVMGVCCCPRPRSRCWRWSARSRSTLLRSGCAASPPAWATPWARSPCRTSCHPSAPRRARACCSPFSSVSGASGWSPRRRSWRPWATTGRRPRGSPPCWWSSPRSCSSPGSSRSRSNSAGSGPRGSRSPRPGGRVRVRQPVGANAFFVIEHATRRCTSSARHLPPERSLAAPLRPLPRRRGAI